MATRRIKFIGKTANKRDNVCRSNLFWSYPGDIVEVPEDIAVRLISFRDVWVEADDNDEGRPIGEDPIEQLKGNLTRDERVAIAIGIIEKENAFIDVMLHFDSEYEAIDPVDHDANDTRLQEGVGDDVTGEGLGDATTQPPVPTIAFSVVPAEAIIQAIEALDRDNEDHFTKEGIPRVEAIEGLLNYSITAADRTVAWDTIQESEGN